MKHKTIALWTFFILIAFAIDGTAEFVFKKDGSIVKGSIVRDEPSRILIKNDKGVIERIERNIITRILYADLYMGKVFVRLTTGKVLEGYQVDEDRDNYIFRKDITKTEEFSVPRKKVMFIARTNPTDLKALPAIEHITITWSPPFKPAKKYRIYKREVKKGENFKIAGETADTSYTLKKLNKSASYEIYATAIGDQGEESLPSEKIIVNTIPSSPTNMAISESYSVDRKKVTLTFTWNTVTDPLCRVKTYAIYKLDGDEKKKLASVTNGRYVIKDFPAEGRHTFAVCAVNDLATESTEIKAVFNAGYRLYARAMGAYLSPRGSMRQLAPSGYGGTLAIGLAGKWLSIGIETGFFGFSCADADIKSMGMVPLLAGIDVKIPLFLSLSLRPTLKGGIAYNMTQYIEHDRADPAITRTSTKNAFNPLVAGGAYLSYIILENIEINAGAEYRTIMQQSGTMSFISYSFGAGIIF